MNIGDIMPRFDAAHARDFASFCFGFGGGAFSLWVDAKHAGRRLPGRWLVGYVGGTGVAFICFTALAWALSP